MHAARPLLSRAPFQHCSQFLCGPCSSIQSCGSLACRRLDQERCKPSSSLGAFTAFASVIQNFSERLRTWGCSRCVFGSSYLAAIAVCMEPVSTLCLPPSAHLAFWIFASRQLGSWAVHERSRLCVRGTRKASDAPCRLSLGLWAPGDSPGHWRLRRPAAHQCFQCILSARSVRSSSAGVRAAVLSKRLTRPSLRRVLPRKSSVQLQLATSACAMSGCEPGSRPDLWTGAGY